MRQKLLRILAAAGLVILLTMPAQIAGAAGTDVFNSVDCSGLAADSAVCQDKTDKNPVTGRDGILLKVTKIVALAASIIAIIIIIIAGLQYIFSQGDANKAQTARNTLLYAIVGLIIIAVAQSIITFVLGKL